MFFPPQNLKANLQLPSLDWSVGLRSLLPPSLSSSFPLQTPRSYTHFPSLAWLHVRGVRAAQPLEHEEHPENHTCLTDLLSHTSLISDLLQTQDLYLGNVKSR